MAASSIEFRAEGLPPPAAAAFAEVVTLLPPVRSGLIRIQCRPPSMVFKTYCVPRKSEDLSTGEKASGGVQASRYFLCEMSVPNTVTGQGETSCARERRRSQRDTAP